MNYYISDLHLFHEASIRFDNRPFASLEEMHEAVVSRWNNKVNNGDNVMNEQWFYWVIYMAVHSRFTIFIKK